MGVNDTYGSVSHPYATGKGGSGFVGVNGGSLYANYFDASSTDTTTAVGSGSSAGVTAIGGSTGFDPYQGSSYAGFDFTNVWAIQPGSSRPYLVADPQTPPPT